LMNWQNVSQQDANSFSINPEFTAADWSVPTNSDMSGLGITLPGIDVDIEGTLRSDPPDVGAYEFEDCDLPLTGPIVGDVVVCEGDVTTYFINTIPGDFTFHWSVEGDATISSGEGSSLITVEFGTGTVMIFAATEDSCGIGPATELLVTSNPLPEVTLKLQTEITCLSGPTIELTGGSPEGGDYSGPGVSANIFSPEMAGVGVHLIHYTYTDSAGCTNMASDTLEVEICTSVDDLVGQSAFNAYPNPFHNILQLELPGSHSGPADVRIFDVTGKVVWQQTVQLLPNEQQLTLSVDNLGTGSYIISLSNAEVHLTQTIVKL
jgi:hypothetical protein